MDQLICSKWTFETAAEAFEELYYWINKNGLETPNTKYVQNATIVIKRPEMASLESISWRNWKLDYAQAEWEWYLSGSLDPTPVISAGATLWDKLRDDDGYIRSNYGFWWNENNQLYNVINLLREDPGTRRATISLFDGKECDIKHDKDVLCTTAITFYIFNSKLFMNVHMRSNDLWYGWSNDQYCFSQLMQLIAGELGIELGYYIHQAVNLHIYKPFLNKNK